MTTPAPAQLFLPAPRHRSGDRQPPEIPGLFLLFHAVAAILPFVVNAAPIPPEIGPASGKPREWYTRSTPGVWNPAGGNRSHGIFLAACTGLTFVRRFHSLFRLVFLATGLMAVSGGHVAEATELPDIGDSARSSVSPAEERRMGEAVIRNIRRAGGLIEDLLLTGYLNDLGYRLVAANNQAGARFQFFLVNDPEINAFALPGGFIGVHYGLLRAARSESELAAVLAHEIAHVTQRHHARAYENQSGSIPVVAAVIAAMILGANADGSTGDLAQAAVAGAAAHSAQSQLDAIRGNEAEADRVGITLLARAGFEPLAMADFFDQLARHTRLYGPQAPEFLRTHPVTERRIADARARARSLARRPPRPESAFHHMRARLRVLTATDKREVREEFRANLAQGRYADRAAERYGYALALLETGDAAAAAAQLAPLLERDPDRIAYRALQARLARVRGQTRRALALYREALAVAPDNAVLTYGYAETLLAAGRHDEAATVLAAYLRQPGRAPAFYRLLARVETERGRSADAHEAMAEYYYQTGLTHQALDQLQVARREGRLDFYQASRIDARIRAWEEELAQQASRSSQ